VFFLSLGWSLVFVAVVYLAWNWIAGFRRRGDAAPSAWALGIIERTDMKPLLDLIPTPQGDVTIITKTRFFFFFSRPRTSVMPHGFSEFGRRLGFQAVYRTSDPAMLAEFHAFFAGCVAAGGFEPMMLGVKMVSLTFPKDRNI
jgi:hypothetical protein